MIFLLSSENLKYLILSLNHTPTMVDLSLSSCSKIGSWSSFQPLKYIKRLDLSGTLSATDDVNHIAVSLSEMIDLVELNLSGNFNLMNWQSIFLSISSIKVAVGSM